MLDINYNKIKLVIFDLDGTLYDLSAMRRDMMWEMLTALLLNPLKIRHFWILYHFRKQREAKSEIEEQNQNISTTQYLWCTHKTHHSTDKIKSIVNEWIRQRPLKHLHKYIYNQAKSYIKTLQQKGIQTAIYSDYHAEDKIKALGITVDHIFSSEQKEIDRLKPHPKGLLYIAKTLKLNTEELILIGDRDMKDGECARRANAPYLILDPEDANSHYSKLISQLSS